MTLREQFVSEDNIENIEYLEDSDSSIWNIDTNSNNREQPLVRNRKEKTKRMRKKRKMFSCELCSETFKNARLLTSHQVGVHRERYLTCMDCDKSFKSTKMLKQHRVIHLNKHIQLPCQTCGACFIEKRRLDLHKLIHLKPKPIKCDKCTKTFSHHSNYRRHLVVHSGVRPFQCDCGHRFSNSTKLKYHKEKHQREPIVQELFPSSF